VKLLHKKKAEEEKQEKAESYDKKVEELQTKVQDCNEEKHQLVSVLKQGKPKNTKK
jgi:hypothetical protein